MDASTISNRQLNRTLLERQLLLERSALTPTKAIEQLLGLQAQAVNPPYLALWSRLIDFNPLSLSKLLKNRKIVRVAAMRSTIHMLTPDDCFALRAMSQLVIERATMSNHGKALKDIDLKKVAQQTRKLLTKGPLTPPQLGEALQKTWPLGEANDLAMLARAALPLIQPIPRGLWRRPGQTMVFPADEWLGIKAPEKPATIDEIVIRYLKAFGPASVMDFQTWSGVTKAKEAFDRLGSKLITYNSENGKVLYDNKNAKLTDEGTPAPVRFIPELDNVMLSHADRTRIISEEHRKRIASRNGMPPGAILVDGFFAGSWRLDRKATVTLEITPFQKLTRAQTSEVKQEGAGLLKFLVPESKHAIAITD